MLILQCERRPVGTARVTDRWQFKSYHGEGVVLEYYLVAEKVA